MAVAVLLLLQYEAPPKKIKEYQMLTKRRIYERKKLEEM